MHWPARCRASPRGMHWPAALACTHSLRRPLSRGCTGRAEVPPQNRRCPSPRRSRLRQPSRDAPASPLPRQPLRDAPIGRTRMRPQPASAPLTGMYRPGRGAAAAATVSNSHQPTGNTDRGRPHLSRQPSGCTGQGPRPPALGTHWPEIVCQVALGEDRRQHDQAMNKISHKSSIPVSNSLPWGSPFREGGDIKSLGVTIPNQSTDQSTPRHGNKNTLCTIKSP